MLLSLGSKGSLVQALQNNLTKLGYILKPDGIFGAQTKSAVIAFQKKNGLVADGIVGVATNNKINSLLESVNPITAAFNTAVLQPTSTTPIPSNSTPIKPFTPPAPATPAQESPVVYNVVPNKSPEAKSEDSDLLLYAGVGVVLFLFLK
ncbi:MAG: peptidoglycan-binding domain-containing protein [Leptospira sp.]|nr:peptidoglycan-binding domain-containing protein [Leptospira sp.]